VADRRKILFWKKALICDNVIVRTLANISKCSIGLILSKYCIQSISINTNDIKLRMWKHFVDDCRTWSSDFLLGLDFDFINYYVYRFLS